MDMGWKCKIESIGVKYPETSLHTGDLVKRIKIPGFSKFGLLTGISERRICTGDEDSYSLALAAARDCLTFSRYGPGDLDMIINCSITKYKDGLSHQYEPAFSLLIKNGIGAVKARSFDISNACAGMMTGLYIAETFISRGIIKNCLIVSGEYISNIADHAVRNIKTPLSSEISSLTVGDCGAAVIIERTDEQTDGIIISGFTTLSRYCDLCSGRQNRKSEGGRMKTKSRKIHEAAISNSLPVVEEALKKSGLTFSQINFLIPHQTSRSSILSGASIYENYFGEKPDHLVLTLRDTGNTASTTHFVALYRYLNDRRFNPGDRIMLLCFASGLVIGVVIITMNEMVYRYGHNN